MEFSVSKTKINLMKAFVGESQARNRYAIAASAARHEKLFVVEQIFNFTAEQERQHARVFYDFLKPANNESISISGDFPVNNYSSVLEHLEAAVRNETAEYTDVYKTFAANAKNEGFNKISESFEKIAEIEGVHAARFANILNLIKSGMLFSSVSETKWACLKCGFEWNGKNPPEICPVCGHRHDYFVNINQKLLLL
jgi:rubrerythrin